jgi:hypothetical protein
MTATNNKKHNEDKTTINTSDHEVEGWTTQVTTSIYERFISVHGFTAFYLFKFNISIHTNTIVLLQ